jgi:hypothetical protein
MSSLFLIWRIDHVHIVGEGVEGVTCSASRREIHGTTAGAADAGRVVTPQYLSKRIDFGARNFHLWAKRKHSLEQARARMVGLVNHSGGETHQRSRLYRASLGRKFIQRTRCASSSAFQPVARLTLARVCCDIM